MKKFAQVLIDKLNLFLGNTVQEPLSEEEADQREMMDKIELALYKKAAVHVIYSNQKSITGEIVKWDQDRQQLIVKNFSKKMSAIIRLRTIQKISLVPEGIRKSQKSLDKSSSKLYFFVLDTYIAVVEWALLR